MVVYRLLKRIMGAAWPRPGSGMAGALALTIAVVLNGCGEGPLNSPYPGEDPNESILYTDFSERPKHLDPVRSYSATEYELTGQIYEPPLQYHYLKRPYTLEPLAAATMPKVRYIDAQGRTLPADAPIAKIAYSIYDITIKPGIRYQPHPAFAKDGQGNELYQHLTATDLEEVHTLADFPETGSRELVAADYVYQIKRMAHPKLHSPIFGLMTDYIVGLKEYAGVIKQAYEEQAAAAGRESVYLDLSQYPLEGVEVVDRYRYRIKVKGKYPQLQYWLAMNFFAPMPPEADRFYSQPGMAEKNISLDWYPVGTGPYMLTVNNPNLRMVMERNPNFHGELYPSDGAPGDEALGLLKDAGQPMPFIDKVVFNLEKETIPYWNKFLQGYYDISGINSESFDQAVRIGDDGKVILTEAMQEQEINLLTSVATTTFYLGINMLDPVWGGNGEQARKLRRAIAIAIDYEEYISIFLNGRGISAHSPLPPGIFGYREGEAGINPYVYDWVDGKAVRKPISEAKRLLKEAGYPEGVDSKTGKALVINLDITATGPDARPLLEWFRKQFKKLGIQLIVRDSDYNRFQEKLRKGSAQLFFLGWNADYPDPENFFFLLHGPNGKVKYQGENGANYDNPEFNRLFDKMKNMDNSPERAAIIDKMVDIYQQDLPWVGGFHPKGFALFHSWYHNAKPNVMANNLMKYKRIDPQLRAQKRREWNQPVIWPVVVVFIILCLGTVPAITNYIRREKRAIHKGADGRMTGGEA